jgi:NDP-sugar pyrophosphorylase family protein
MEFIKTEELFDLSHTAAKDLLEKTVYPHEALPKIKDFVISYGKSLSPEEYERVAEDVYISKEAKISPLATIEGPTVIGKGTEVRPGAYIRGAALIGEGVVVGNSTEIKNAIIFDGVQVPHYNYVGDSILGYKSHMGAGAIASNFKLDHNNITLRAGGGTLDTGLRKFGAILGDFAEVGCGSVLCPGTVIGRESLIYPLCRVRGTIPHRTIFDGEILKERK